MLRKLVILGVFTGMSAAVPVIYQANPELVSKFVSEPEAEAPAPRVAAVRTESDDSAQPSGRKTRLPVDAQGHFIADFKFNGRRVSGMIDTGATMVAINKSTARKIGLNLAPDDFKHEVTTANGATMAAAAVIDSIQIGRITVENVQAVVLDDKALKGTLIGMTFLNELKKYQVADGSLLLEQ